MNQHHSFEFSGLADEAGKDISTQIRAHQELGWRAIELRMVNGIQFTDLSDGEFEETCAQLAAADIQVSGFGSAIANWSTKITDPFEKTTETLARAIQRMNRLGTRFIRVMSYPNDNLSEERWRDEVVRRFQILGQMAEEGGIVLVVENCDGWASVSPHNYSDFFERVDSPTVKAVYDTGNPASHGHINTWEWYQAAKPHIAYVHIKAHTGPGGTHTWPDSGASEIEETIQDLLSSSYKGFISIEPHIQSVIHEKKGISNQEASYQSYIEYGYRLMQLVERVEQASNGY